MEDLQVSDSLLDDPRRDEGRSSRFATARDLLLLSFLWSTKAMASILQFNHFIPFPENARFVRLSKGGQTALEHLISETCTNGEPRRSRHPALFEQR